MRWACMHAVDDYEYDTEEDVAMTKVLRDVKYVVEKEISDTDARMSWDEYSDPIPEILLALRLLKRGNVRAHVAFQVYKMGEGTYLSKISDPSPAYEPSAYEWYIGEPYHLTKPERGSFCTLFWRLKNRARPQLNAPISQFTKAFETDTRENIVVRMWNAFEMLAFDTLSLTEEAQRLGARGKVVGFGIAKILGNLDERNGIMENVQKFFRLRCARGIAHGVNGHVDFSDENTRQLIIISEHYLRSSIRKLLEGVDKMQWDT